MQSNPNSSKDWCSTSDPLWGETPVVAHSLKTESSAGTHPQETSTKEPEFPTDKQEEIPEDKQEELPEDKREELPEEKQVTKHAEIPAEWDNFDGLDMVLQRGVYAHGFERPTPVQQKAIPACLTGRDCIVQAQAGTGKTGGFLLPILQRIDMNLREVQAIVLAPTRELADQIQKVAAALGYYTKLRCMVLMGGRSFHDDLNRLRDGGIQLIVATPGRLLSVLNMSRSPLRTDWMTMLAIDEADEMLSKGFEDSVRSLLETIPQDTQVMLFSATIPADVLELSERFMRDPIRLLIKKEQITLDGLKQFYVNVGRQENKLETLLDLFELLSVSQSVIFCNSRERVDYLARELNTRDYTVSYMHGQSTPEERNLTMHEFRTGSSRILLTTDLLSRGIDIKQVQLVLNYDLPRQRETYIHRIGRSARHGCKGISISFTTPDEMRQLRDLERFYDTQIEEMPVDVAKYM